MSETSPNRTCLIIDPGLRVSSGHHLNAARHIVETARDAGFRTRILASRFASGAVRGGLGAEPVFTNSAYSVGDGSQASYDRYAVTTSDALISALGPDFSVPELIVLPTADAALAEALAGYLELFPADLRPGVVAWLLLPRDFLRMNTPEPDGGGVRGFQRLDAALGPGRLAVFVETEAVQASFAKDFSAPIQIAPSPSTALQTVTPRRRAAAGAPVFSAFGHIRPGKGFELLPGAIAAAAAKRPDIAFRIHATPNAPDHPALLAAIEQAADNVEVIGHELDGPAYEALLHGADVAILPYDPEIYRERGSGIFNECEQLGTPVIAPSGCSFATRAIADGRAVPMDGYGPEALGAAIIVAADQFEALSARCYDHAVRLQDGVQSLGRVLRATANAPISGATRPAGAGRVFWRARILHRLRELARIGTIRKARTLDRNA
ncbi:MAG: hypothetical protein AAFY80_11170 [Pseudomonadota bacterium]